MPAASVAAAVLAYAFEGLHPAARHSSSTAPTVTGTASATFSCLRVMRDSSLTEPTGRRVRRACETLTIRCDDLPAGEPGHRSVKKHGSTGAGRVGETRSV